MQKLKHIGMALASVLLFVMLFVFLQELVKPKYATDIPEGNFTSEYYSEKVNHDVVMIGDCEVYENINPMYLWDNYGISSYIRGNAQQLVWQSYYMLEDTLKYEKPKVIIYNVQSLSHAEPQKEEYNRMTLDGLRWSETKLNAIKASMCDEESLVDYMFPILRYHSRITELGKEDIEYLMYRNKISNNGYYLRMDVIPYSESDAVDGRWLFDKIGLNDSEEQDSDKSILTDEIIDPWADIDVSEQNIAEAEESEKEADRKADRKADKDTGKDTEKENDIDSDNDIETSAGDKQFGDYPMMYLNKIRELCENNGITLILMKAPSLSPRWYDEENNQVVEYAKKYDISYINFYDLIKELDINYETDTYDGGLHMNYYGACKISEYIGKYLSDNCDIPDRRNDEDYAQEYSEKMRYYNDMKEKQLSEIQETGKVKY